MFKSIIAGFIILALTAIGYAANSIGAQKLVDTELAFAKKAADTNTRQAFLDFAADDGVVFNPTVLNAKAFWEKRAVSPSLLAWHPDWADVSADGQAGWDTGPWEFHPKGKGDAATAFGQFATFWVKQKDGSFKFAVDMGIGFEKSGFTGRTAEFPSDVGGGKRSVADKSHFDLAEKLFTSPSLSKAYAGVLADDCILLIDDKPVIRGKKDVLAEFAKQDAASDAKDTVAVDVKDRRVYGNLSYLYGEFTRTRADKSIQRHNFFQVWKYRNGRWKMVLSVFTDIPNKA
jgi:ketosteroid isomerase-like protein